MVHTSIGNHLSAQPYDPVDSNPIGPSSSSLSIGVCLVIFYELSTKSTMRFNTDISNDVSYGGHMMKCPCLWGSGQFGKWPSTGPEKPAPLYKPCSNMSWWDH